MRKTPQQHAADAFEGHIAAALTALLHMGRLEGCPRDQAERLERLAGTIGDVPDTLWALAWQRIEAIDNGEGG